MGCYNNYDGYGCRDPHHHGYYRDRYEDNGLREPYGPRGPFAPGGFGPCGRGPCHDNRPYPQGGFFFGFPRIF